MVSQAIATICVAIKAQDLSGIFLVVRVQNKSAPTSLEPAHLLSILPSCLQYTRNYTPKAGMKKTFFSLPSISEDLRLLELILYK